MLKRYTRRLADGTMGKWYRAEKYAIITPGDSIASIAPAVGARRVETDPWGEFYRPLPGGERRAGVIERPYSAFLRLGFAVTEELEALKEMDPVDWLSDAANQLIENWVSQHGLLGYLQATMDFCILPTRPFMEDTSPRVVRPVAGKAWTWRVETDIKLGYGFGKLLKSGLMINTTQTRLTITNPDSELPWYFPRVIDPAIHEECWTPGFEHQYGEPTLLIARVAHEFLRRSITFSNGDASVRREALPHFTELTYNTEPQFGISPKGDLMYEHASPALISSYALMFLWDVMEGLSVWQCESCGTPFVRNKKEVRFCSVRCRHRERTQRYRERQREKTNGARR